MRSKLETLGSLLHSNRKARDLIEELRGRGIDLAFENELSEAEQNKLAHERMTEWPARDSLKGYVAT